MFHFETKKKYHVCDFGNPTFGVGLLSCNLEFLISDNLIIFDQFMLKLHTNIENRLCNTPLRSFTSGMPKMYKEIMQRNISRVLMNFGYYIEWGALVSL